MLFFLRKNCIWRSGIYVKGNGIFLLSNLFKMKLTSSWKFQCKILLTDHGCASRSLFPSSQSNAHFELAIKLSTAKFEKVKTLKCDWRIVNKLIITRSIFFFCLKHTILKYLNANFSTRSHCNFKWKMLTDFLSAISFEVPKENSTKCKHFESKNTPKST